MDEEVLSESPGRAAVIQAQASLFSPSSWQRSAHELRGYTHAAPSKPSSKRSNKKNFTSKKSFKRTPGSHSSSSGSRPSFGPYYYDYAPSPSNSKEEHQVSGGSFAEIAPETVESKPSDTASVSSSDDSQSSLSSGEYAAVLDYLANVDPDQEGGQILLKQMRHSTGVVGMDTEETEAWAPPSVSKASKRQARIDAKKQAKAARKAQKRATKKELQKPSTSPARLSRSGTPATPHSRQGSTSSTPMSWGKREKRGVHMRMASPLPLPQLRARYDLPFVAAIDPISKLVDDDALIVVPHDRAMAEAFAATDHQHIAVEIFVDTIPVHDIASPSAMVCDETGDTLDHVTVMDVTIEQLMMSDSEEEDSEEDSMENEESYEEDGDENEDMEGSQEEQSEEYGEEEEEADEDADGSSEFGSDSLEDYFVDSDESDDGDLSSTESFNSTSISDDFNMEGDDDGIDSDAGSDEEGGQAPKARRPTKNRDLPSSPTPNVRIPGRNTNNDEALLRRGMVTREGVQLKHDTRRRKKQLSPYSRQQPDQPSGEFQSQKKLSKAEKKKQKQRSRDEKPLELHELHTWNGLIRDFIIHTPAGTTMPFSPMGRFQRKQLHWLSEFYGLRSQSFGSGTRRMTHVFVTKRTQVPEMAVALAACRAIRDGRHPFSVSSAELEQGAMEVSKIAPSKRSKGGSTRDLERSGGRLARNKKAAGKDRSPLLRTPQPSHFGKRLNRQQRRQQERQTRRSRMDAGSDEEDHHGLDLAAPSNTKRLVGAGAAHIPESNLGHLMLRKLGWANGGLGKEQQGIAHPIQAIIKDGRRGLGSQL